MIRQFILLTTALMIAASPAMAQTQKKTETKKQDTSATVIDVVEVPNPNKYLVTGEGHRSDIRGLEGMELTDEQLHKISDLRVLSLKNEKAIRNAAQQAIDNNRNQLINDIAKVLTPEQAKVYKEKQALYKERQKRIKNSDKRDHREGHKRHHHKSHNNHSHDKGHGCCR